MRGQAATVGTSIGMFVVERVGGANTWTGPATAGDRERFSDDELRTMTTALLEALSGGPLPGDVHTSIEDAIRGRNEAAAR